jgi:sugar lactone lactonase YvrE
MSEAKTTKRILGLAGVLALQVVSREARADNDAFHLAAKVPTGQAVLLSQGRVAVAAPAQGRVLLIDSVGNTSVIAGTGEVGFSGDGGPATKAAFSSPTSLAADSAGNLYVADAGNSRVRRIDPMGVVTTVAGNGEVGSSGDGGPAVNASFDSLAGLAVDPQGNLFIADSGNHRIRKVDAAGTVTTVAGIGEPGFDGDGGDARSARLNTPTGIAFDASRGRLLVADTGSHAVRGLEADGTIVTLAGTGRAGFSGDRGPWAEARLSLPTGVGVDANGNVYVADTGNHRVRILRTTGIILTLDETIQTPVRVVAAKAPIGWRIQVTSPTAGFWRVGSAQVIRWNHNFGPGTLFAVELSRDGGLTWESIANVSVRTASVSVNWRVTKGSTTTALVRVRNVAGPQTSALSAAFAIGQTE